MKIITILALANVLLAIETSVASSPVAQNDVSAFNARGRRKLQRCREKDDDEFRTAARGNKRPCSWLKNDKDHIKDECGNRKSDADEVCPITCGACKDDADDDEDEDEPDDLGKDFDELEYLGGGFKGHGKCSGNCRKDYDCKRNLECFEREDGEDVPGCEGKGKDGVNYCFDPSDVVTVQQHDPVVMEIAPKTFSPSRAPTSNKPTDMPTPSPIRKPTDMPTLEERADPTAFPALAPVVQENMEKQGDEGVEEIMPEDIGVQVSPFFVGITFLTPSRRRLGVLADNISANKLESTIADVVGQKMLTIYPDTFQDIDIEAEFFSETKQEDITTVTDECSGQAIFLDAFSSVEGSRLPHAKDLRSIVLEALDGDILSKELKSSDDAVLSASQAAFISAPGKTVLSSSDDSSDDISVGIFVLVAVIVGCVVLIGTVFVCVYRIRSNGKKSSLGTLDERNGVEFVVDGERSSAIHSVSKEKDGIVPSPSRTNNTDLENSYDRDSDAGEYSVGYSESILESIIDGGSIGRHDGGSIKDAFAEVAGKSSGNDPDPDIRAGNLRALDA